MSRVPFKLLGLVISILPLLLAFVTSIFQGGSMWNEGTGTGAYLWFLMFTVPVGLLMIVIGFLTR